MTLIKNAITIAALFLSINGAAQNVNNYLSNHAIDLSKGSQNLKIKPDSSFFNHQLFILGEIHGIQKGQDVDYDLVTMLNREVNLNTYIGEFDFAKAYFLNQYLKTGNEKLIAEVTEDWVKDNSQWANKELQNKFKRIRLYNQQVKPNHQLYFEGIDQIHNPVLVARYLKEVLKAPHLQKIRPSFQPLIAALTAKNDSLILSVSTGLLNDTEFNKQLKAFKEFEMLRFALKNCALKHTEREALLHSNFADLYRIRNWKNKKLYAFFGFAHVIQAKANQGKHQSLALRIDRDENLALKGKVLSIAMLYVDSKMMIPTFAIPEEWQEKGKRFTAVDQFNHDGPMVEVEGITDFKAVTKPNTTTLFNLEAAGSPYLRKVLSIKYADSMLKGQGLLLNEEGKYTTDYFQYIVLVRNSEATLPIQNE